MVRHKLDSISECASRGYNLRITCRKCGHAVEANAVLLQIELGGTIAKMPLDRFESRARCTVCGHRGAKVMPCLINF